MALPPVAIKRAYSPPSPADGVRVLVDRVWPRGLTRDQVAVDRWMKEVAPTTELRRWFGHDPRRWDGFVQRYRVELAANPVPLEELRNLARSGPLTLVYGARDEDHNQAIVLRNVLLAE